jgi:polysaccharide biosynthesis transport protein
MVDPMRSDLDASGDFGTRQTRSGSTPSFLRDPWGVLRRNWLLIAVCTAVLLGGIYFYTSRMRPVYQVATTIRIDEKQSRLPTVDILQLAGGNEVDTEMEMLRSRSLAESVTDSLALQLQLLFPWERRGAIFSGVRVPRDAPAGAYELERQPDGSFRLDVAGTDSTIIARIPAGAPIVLGSARLELTPLAYEYPSVQFVLTAFEDAVAGIQSVTTVNRRNREANLVTVAVQGVDPVLVRDIANLLSSDFIEARRVVQHSEARSTVSFLQAQLAKLTEELQHAEDELRSFREREQIVSLEDEARTGVSQLADVRAQRNALEAERVALVRLLDEVRRTGGDSSRGASPYRQLAAFPTLLRNSAVVDLLSNLAATEASRAELHKSTALDPDVEVLEQHSRELELQLESITSTYLKGLGSQVAALDSGIALSERRLDQIPQRELNYARLDRKAKTLEDIVTLLQSRLKEAEIAEAVGDPSVRLVDAAILPTWPIRPNLPLNLALGMVAGLTLGFAAAFMREYRDKSVHTRRDVLFATGAPVLGLIPHTRRNGRLRGRGATPKQIPARTSTGERTRALISRKERGPDISRLLLPGADHQGPLAEANNSLATNLAFARPDASLQLLVVTSPSPGDGKTTTAINLAITFAKRGRKVLLVDADLRRGIVSSLLGLNRSPGLSTVLNGGVDFRTVVQKVDLQAGVHRGALFTALSGSPIPADSMCSLHVLTTGALPDNPAALLASARAQSTLNALRQEYDTIIVDSPPVNAAGDASLLGTNSDGVLIVARAGVTASEALAFTMEQLNAVRAPVLGGILNDIDFDRDVTYDGTYRYYSYKSLYTAENSEAVS